MGMKRLETFKGFMNLTAQRKCPPGFKFDDTLKVCVPKFPRSSSYYGGFGHSHSKDNENGNGSNGSNGSTTNANGNGNGNGNGGNGGNGGGE